LRRNSYARNALKLSPEPESAGSGGFGGIAGFARHSGHRRDNGPAPKCRPVARRRCEGCALEQGDGTGETDAEDGTEVQPGQPVTESVKSAISQSGESVVAESGDLAVPQSGESVVAESGQLVVAESGESVVAESGQAGQIREVR
jgi:hypothetical protein